MNVELQMKLARKAGAKWLEEYEYHVATVDKPLPFYTFKRKVTLLDALLKADPDGKKPWLDTKIDQLCAELGY